MERRSHTVIIPTRERCDTLIASLRSVTEQNYDQLQIIVSDNASQDATKQVIDDADDARILYINPGRRLSMSHHYEFALAHATNDWLTIIGDDDALLPGCLDKVNELVDATGVKLIRSSVCQYVWPGDGESAQATLSIPMKRGFEARNSRRQLSRMLHGWDGYRSLPMIYNGGFVERQAMHSAAFGGQFYHSCIPDVYSGVLLAQVLSNYLFSYEPLAVNGRSKHSTGASQFSAVKLPNSPSHLFRSEGNIAFHASIPLTDDEEYPPSLHAITYESCAQVDALLPDALQLPPSIQLQVILAMARNNFKEVLPWARKFANQHNLNFNRELSLAKIRAVGYSLKRKYERMSGCKDKRISEADICIADSYQASLVAADVLRKNRVT